MKPTTLLLLTVLLVFSTTTRGRRLCQRGWKVFNNHCYLFKTDQLSWRNAHGICKGADAKLVDILSSRENEFVRQRIRGYTWTALKQSKWQLVWNSNFDDPLGEEDFIDWEDGRPTTNREGACILFNLNDEWSSMGCHHRRRYVCKKEESGGCSENWEKYGSYCYYFSSYSYPWAEASYRCSSNGGRLADIRGRGEYSFVWQNLRGISWIGLHLVRRYWSNGNTNDQPTYRRFHAGHPNRNDPVSCIRTDRHGFWSDYDCSRRHAFVCKKEAGCPIPESPLNASMNTSNRPPFRMGDVITYVCSDGYEVTSGNAVRTCQPDLKFNGTAPVCSEVEKCVPEEGEDGCPP